jgi:hypothetical protein
MIGIYPAKYSDRNGQETTTIYNDGKQLRLRIRGIDFIGDDFESFEPITNNDSGTLDSFSFFPVAALMRGDKNNPDQSRDTQMLRDYLLEFDIPISVIVDTEVIQSELHVHLDLRDLNDKSEKNTKYLLLELIYNDRRVKSPGQYGDFESELSFIQRSLPQDVYIKACINCAYSDFGPYQGMFGALGCYRGNKQEYQRIRNSQIPGTKWLLLKIMTEPVQETYLCPEFKREERG